VLSIEVDVSYDVVHPYLHSVIQDGVGLSVSLYSFTEFDDGVYLRLSRFTAKPKLVTELRRARG